MRGLRPGSLLPFHQFTYRSLVAFLATSGVAWLAPSAASPPAQHAPAPEVQAHETMPPFRLRVERNLVTVPVVVRGPKGQVVSNLHQDDFRLFDSGKLQEITGFSVETATTPAPTQTAPSQVTKRGGGAEPAPAMAPPAPYRFVGLYFDDFHLQAEEIDRTRDAAWRYVASLLQLQDRVAIFTATGMDQLDFTDDRAKLHEALLRLVPIPRNPKGCPEIEDYEAYLVTKQSAPEALAVLHVDAVKCVCGENYTQADTGFERPTSMLGTTPQELEGADPCPREAMRRAEAEAAAVWSQAEKESQYSLQGIENSVRRLAAMPGRRTLVLVSAGFLTETLGHTIDTVIDWALRQNVIISAVDAAGLYVYQHRTSNLVRPDIETHRGKMEDAALVRSRDALASLRAGTGGIFFHNSNDFDDGFRQTAAVPETLYVLSFSPTNFKPDGRFHALRVVLNAREPYAVQARRGYFAASSATSSQAASQNELQKLVFSLEELQGLPMEVSTRLEQMDNQKSKLTVVVHVGVRLLQLRKEKDRSVDTLIFDTALFDANGGYVSGKESSLDLRLRDATLRKFSQSGIYAKTSFEVLPGTYRIREVVRDTESKQMSALNSNVVVPGRSQ